MNPTLIEVVSQKNEILKNGQIVEATEQFFAPNAKTVDFDGTTTYNKNEMISKMQGFAGAIAKVNNITLHHSSVNNNVSFAEFTFDFDMKDGTKIVWHEILRSIWEDGQIVHEQYFKS